MSTGTGCKQVTDFWGDAVVVGTFRVTCRARRGRRRARPRRPVPSVMRKIDGEWRMWREMDTPSPDADKYYEKQPRGW